MQAPLAANVNDKGCAFGGSLCSLMTIAGWGLAFLELAKAGHEADIYIADSRVRSLKPVYEDLLVDVRLDTAGEGGADAIDLPGALRSKGRASVRMEARASSCRSSRALRSSSAWCRSRASWSPFRVTFVESSDARCSCASSATICFSWR